MCYEIILPKNFMFSGVGVGRYWQQRQEARGTATRARERRVEVAQGRVEGRRGRAEDESNWAPVFLHRNPYQITMPTIKGTLATRETPYPPKSFWLFGVLYSLLVSTLFSSTVFYHPIYKKDIGNRVCSPRGFRIPKGSSRK